MSEQSGEKTEEPTQKKIDDSRKKGQVWKSKDLTGVAVFLAGLGAVKVSWDMTEGEFRELFAFAFDRLAHPGDLNAAVFQLLGKATISVMLLTIPVAFTAALVGGLVEFLQVGPLFSKEALMPKLEKLNAIEGMKNLLGKKQIVEGIKSMLKLGLAGYIVYGVLRDDIALVMLSVRFGPSELMQILADLTFTMTLRIGLLFTVFAIFDTWWQRRVYYKDLMMTKDEVKREYKESEGDPHNKAKRKEFAMELLEAAQMDAVKGADVIVTNPDHVAVALQYDRAKDGAPRVIARGIDSRAEAIKALAREYEVPLMRNVPLAHALLRVELNEEVPEQLYDAVAEVLNFVYGLKGSEPAPARVAAAR